MTRFRAFRPLGSALGATAIACTLLCGGITWADSPASITRTHIAQAEAPHPPEEAVPAAPESTATEPRGGRHLQLPDISLVGSATGRFSNDRRDADRDRVGLNEAEVSIQGYVYPHLRADAFLVAPGHEEFQLLLEEGYLTHEQLPLRLTGRLGRFFVPFGRDNQKHPHSWNYVRRPLVWRNLVSEESLAGNGINLSWLAPTGRRLFIQLDAGTYTRAGHSHNGEDAHTDHEDGAEEHAHGIPTGPGADFNDTFQAYRLWSGTTLGSAGELELGGSLAQGDVAPIPLAGGALAPRDLRVTGVDLSYRRYGQNVQRLLLRGEYLWHRYQSSLGRQTTEGYYALANYRFDRYHDVGLLYDWSDIPGDQRLHESALSAIYTRQLTEQTYARLQVTHGNRPGKRNYSEAWLQLVWGVGPHTHQLE